MRDLGGDVVGDLGVEKQEIEEVSTRMGSDSSRERQVKDERESRRFREEERAR